MTVQHLAPGVVLLTGDALTTVRYAVRVAIAARHRNGYPVPRELTELAAAVTEPGTTDTEPTRAQHTSTELLDIQETARMLGCSQRQARRLAPQLDGHLHAGRWLIPRAAVDEHVKGRAA
ncbi:MULTISPECIES: helix-turn-helix domain-containing protein [Rhodococcus]|uniref:helix-turn-helix domain-containing protein n=1 Tax=Rhodococcus TaxID=1827 RepID=UPI000D0615D9|nr:MULTISPECIES: helix-turn-helix domain-containing protein [Rhodococcus]AYA23967.1 DNA-binding protein [Rhodococcus rhodochrous]MCD2140430.1 helix-turn-helix domain-containing protein [Rhodococcus pyridinivorans]MCK0091210.1 helix-turn-helix domain-containing protein [Rhodococcus sp. F64268]